MNQLDKALTMAYYYHNGQFDKGGNPYILHPIYISTKFYDDRYKIVALLHDIIEDTEITETTLRFVGFDEDIIESIVAITKISGEAYEEYIDRVSKNKIALMVKIEDMKHNSDLSRVKNIEDIQYMLNKYKKWLPILEKRLELYR